MTNMLIAVVVVGAATASISRLIACEHGPYGILDRFRAWFPQDESLLGQIGRLVSCPICLGVWVGLVLSVLFSVAYGISAAQVWIIIPASIGVAYALIGLGNLWGAGE